MYLGLWGCKIPLLLILEKERKSIRRNNQNILKCETVFFCLGWRQQRSTAAKLTSAVSFLGPDAPREDG